DRRELAIKPRTKDGKPQPMRSSLELSDVERGPLEMVGSISPASGRTVPKQPSRLAVDRDLEIAVAGKIARVSDRDARRRDRRFDLESILGEVAHAPAEIASEDASAGSRAFAIVAAGSPLLGRRLRLERDDFHLLRPRFRRRRFWRVDRQGRSGLGSFALGLRRSLLRGDARWRKRDDGEHERRDEEATRHGAMS